MTPEEKRYRDMWMAECWQPVKEYQQPVDPRSLAVDKPGDARPVKRGRRAA